MAWFEVACVLLIALTLRAMARLRPRAELLRDYLKLALGAWLGEQSCISLYEFYRYAPTWHGRLGDVPILVPLIWPLVVLSACDVARALWPRLGAAPLSLIAAVLVALDASLVEVVAVRAGLWAWAEPGHLGVPLIGILGWAYFAVAAAWVLLRLPPARRWLLVLLGPLGAHALIQLSWWGLFRSHLRGELGRGGLLGVLVAGVLALGVAVLVRWRGGGIPLRIALPRALAASLFFLLLGWVTSRPGDQLLWLHAAAIGLPYCVATRWRTG